MLSLARPAMQLRRIGIRQEPKGSGAGYYNTSRNLCQAPCTSGQGFSRVGESVILRPPDYCREYSGRRILAHVNRDPFADPSLRSGRWLRAGSSGVPYSETCSEASSLVELGEILRFAQDDSPKFLGSKHIAARYGYLRATDPARLGLSSDLGKALVGHPGHAKVGTGEFGPSRGLQLFRLTSRIRTRGRDPARLYCPAVPRFNRSSHSPCWISISAAPRSHTQ